MGVLEDTGYRPTKPCATGTRLCCATPDALFFFLVIAGAGDLYAHYPSILFSPKIRTAAVGEKPVVIYSSSIFITTFLSHL